VPWRIRWSHRAERQLERLGERDRRAVIIAVTRLQLEFGASDMKKLGGADDEWRLRVGRWRVLLDLDNQTGVITITRILPRDRAYRD